MVGAYPIAATAVRRRCSERLAHGPGRRPYNASAEGARVRRDLGGLRLHGVVDQVEGDAEADRAGHRVQPIVAQHDRQKSDEPVIRPVLAGYGIGGLMNSAMVP